MGFVVYLLDLTDGELGVALGGGESFVAEHLLNGAEVGSFFEHVGAEGVAEGVGMDVGGEAAAKCDGFDDTADAAGGKAAVAAHAEVGEEGAVVEEPDFAGGGEAGFAEWQVGADGGSGFVAEGDETLFAAFATDEDGVVLPLDVEHVEADEFGVADAASVEEFEDDAVAFGPGGGLRRGVLTGGGRGGFEGVEDAVDLFHAGDAGEVAGQFGGADEQSWILEDVAFFGEPLEPTADGGEGSGGAGFGESALVEVAKIGADVEMIDGADGGLVAEGGVEVEDEVADFAVVGADGVLGGAALVGDHGEEALGEWVEFRHWLGSFAVRVGDGGDARL